MANQFTESHHISMGSASQTRHPLADHEWIKVALVRKKIDYVNKEFSTSYQQQRILKLI
ncbi:hypothetical protein YC2023_015416 [Brassica napus]